MGFIKRAFTVPHGVTWQLPYIMKHFPKEKIGFLECWFDGNASVAINAGDKALGIAVVGDDLLSSTILFWMNWCYDATTVLYEVDTAISEYGLTPYGAVAYQKLHDAINNTEGAFHAPNVLALSYFSKGRVMRHGIPKKVAVDMTFGRGLGFDKDQRRNLQAFVMTLNSNRYEFYLRSEPWELPLERLKANDLCFVFPPDHLETIELYDRLHFVSVNSRFLYCGKPTTDWYKDKDYNYNYKNLKEGYVLVYNYEL